MNSSPLAGSGPSGPRPRAGVNFLEERPVKTVLFFDGQNLYHRAKEAWAPAACPSPSRYHWPSYDVEKLAAVLTARQAGRVLSQIRFYTGVPEPTPGTKDEFWHGFWSNKIRYLRGKGIYAYTGRISRGGQEKGVDVSIAVDLVDLTYKGLYEAAIIVSQDWDLGPAVKLAKTIAHDKGRQLVFESAFPDVPGKSHRGVPGTTWFAIDKATYDSCFDPRDYRPRSKSAPKP